MDEGSGMLWLPNRFDHKTIGFSLSYFYPIYPLAVFNLPQPSVM